MNRKSSNSTKFLIIFVFIVRAHDYELKYYDSTPEEHTVRNGRVYYPISSSSIDGEDATDDYGS